MTKLLSTLLIVSVLAALVAGLFPSYAYAAASNSDCYAEEGNLNQVFCTVVTQFSSVPKLMSIFSWVGAVTLAIMAFINLKEYGDDPSSVPLRNIIVKFVIALLLISLPLVIKVVGNSLNGTASSSTSAAPALSKRPSFGSGVSGK